MLEHERQGRSSYDSVRGLEQGRLDLALIKAAEGGSSVATDALLARLQCVPRMLAAENARAGHVLGPHDVADTIQDTMLVTWSKLPFFAGTGPLEAWVYRICRLEFLGAKRRRRRLASHSSESFDDVVAADCHSESAQSARVVAALRLLDGIDAELVRQRLWQEADFSTIAQRCGGSIAAVKARYYRAVRRLQRFCALLEVLDAT